MFGRRYRLKRAFLAAGPRLEDVVVVLQSGYERFEKHKSHVPDALN
jgi:hypothetical protein